MRSYSLAVEALFGELRFQVVSWRLGKCVKSYALIGVTA
jgi:hypothetical protein